MVYNHISDYTKVIEREKVQSVIFENASGGLCGKSRTYIASMLNYILTNQHLNAT